MFGQKRKSARLARELHDSLGQGITALQTQIKLFELDGGSAARQWAPGLRELVDGMRHGVREVLEALRPSALSELGLAKAIDSGGLRQMVERAGARFEFTVRGPDRALMSLDDAASAVAFRVVQEAATNALRHGHSAAIAVRLRAGWYRGEPWLLVAIDDDGSGLPPDFREGRGIQGMRDRALTLGGGLALRRSMLGGLSVRAWVRAGRI
jgi:signal transduction histidine kinase